MDQREHTLGGEARVGHRVAADRLAQLLLGVGAGAAPFRWGELGPDGPGRSESLSADAERERILAIVAEVHRRRSYRRARRRIRRTM